MTISNAWEMIEAKTISALRAKYGHVHPLLFHRSVERARSGGDLFDILSTIPDKWPLIWSDNERRWVYTDDILQSKEFDIKTK